MKVFGKLCVLSLLSTLFCVKFTNGADVSAIGDSLKKAQDAFEPSKQMSSFKKLSTSLQVGANLAKAVYSLVKLIKTFTGDNESKELKFLKDQFNIVNTKMDALDYDFAEVKDLIDWSVVKVNFGEYERRIKATERILSDYVGSPLPARKIFEDIFKQTFELHNGDAALKLYYGLANENQIFGLNLFAVARKFYANDRLKVAEFGAYVCRVIQRGINHEAAYMLLSGREKRLDGFIKDWEDRFAVLKKFAAKIDAEIVATWPQQFKVDVDKMVVRTAGGLTPAQLGSNLYKTLDNKFPWRAWIVVVLPNRKVDSDDWQYEMCGQKYERYNVGGKIVLVTSGDASVAPSPSSATVLAQLPGTHDQFSVSDIRKASFVFNKINSRSCNSHAFKGAFLEASAPTVTGAKDRVGLKKMVVVQRKRGSHGIVHVFKKNFWVIFGK